MATRYLTEPVFDGGLRALNFFNGRIVSAEDMSTQALAHQQIDQRLGRALGDGVCYGLEVSEKTGISARMLPVVTIRPGLALNREGQTLWLDAPVDLALTAVPPPANGGAPLVTPFFTCPEEGPESGVYVAGAGLYLLTLSPVDGHEGRAQVSGLGSGNASCGAYKYLRQGVQFRLIWIDRSQAERDQPARLRNLAAYRCFGVQDADYRAFFANPFGPPVEQYGLLDDLRPNRLKDCEVPLALLYFTAADGLSFVDMWSVRRRLTAPVPARWPLLTADRRIGEAEAMFWQFQDHLQGLLASAPGAAAPDVFRFWPPLGIVPVRGDGSTGGFARDTFFGSLASRTISTLDVSLLRELMHEARYHEPIDLSAGQKVQLYWLFENLKAIEDGQTSQRYLVFASSTLPYRGIARFGYADWGADVFAPSVV